MGNSTISMVIFNSYVKLPESVSTLWKNMSSDDDIPNWMEK